MTMFVSGLIIWVAVHLFPSILPNQRQRLISGLGGNVYQGLFALSILAGLLLIIFGWRATEPAPFFVPSAALRQPAMLLNVIAMILFVAANFPATRIKRLIRHPQLSAVLLWSIAHLLSNGDSRSVLMFSVLGTWSLVSMLTINRRDGIWIKPGKPGDWNQDITILIAGIGLSAVVIYFHEYLSGVMLLG